MRGTPGANGAEVFRPQPELSLSTGPPQLHGKWGSWHLLFM
jgi:hypothetical protein